MFIRMKAAAEMLEVHNATLWRWVKQSGLPMPKDSNGKQTVPVVALINYLARTGKLPFRHQERATCNTTVMESAKKC
jgi:predicted site-specific integrase-resolvase